MFQRVYSRHSGGKQPCRCFHSLQLLPAGIVRLHMTLMTYCGGPPLGRRRLLVAGGGPLPNSIGELPGDQVREKQRQKSMSMLCSETSQVNGLNDLNLLNVNGQILSKIHPLPLAHISPPNWYHHCVDHLRPGHRILFYLASTIFINITLFVHAKYSHLIHNANGAGQLKRKQRWQISKLKQQLC